MWIGPKHSLGLQHSLYFLFTSAFSCSKWVRNGFCNSTFYSNAYKMQYCGRACGLC
ncbi:shTK domain protein [Ostertagia ostertagi]